MSRTPLMGELVAVRKSMFLAVLLGCGKQDDPITPIDEETYLSEYVRLFCEIEEECEPGGFDDVEACIEQMTVTVQRKIEDEDCDFDGQLAAECVAFATDASCSAWADRDDECSVSVICGA